MVGECLSKRALAFRPSRLRRRGARRGRPRGASIVDSTSALRNDVRMFVRTNLLLPKELVAEVDRFAGPRGRSRYVAEALAERVRRERMREAFESAAGSLDPSRYPHWSTSEKVIEWVRQLRAEETDPGPG